jgi:hypothetical protein
VPELRPLRDDDVPAALELMVAAFQDLERRFHEPPTPPGDPEPGYMRLRRDRRPIPAAAGRPRTPPA